MIITGRPSRNLSYPVLKLNISNSTLVNDQVEFWRHVVWAVSHSANTRREKNIQRWNAEIKEKFPNASNASLPTVFLDIEDGEKEDIKKDTEGDISE